MVYSRWNVLSHVFTKGFPIGDCKLLIRVVSNVVIRLLTKEIVSKRPCPVYQHRNRA
jgi:hypothetical protein